MLRFMIALMFAVPALGLADQVFPAKMEGNYTLHPVYVEAAKSPYGEVHNNCTNRITVRAAATDPKTGKVTRLEVINRDKGTIDVAIVGTDDSRDPGTISDTYAEHTHYGEFGFKEWRQWAKLYKNSYWWNAPLWNKLKIYDTSDLCEYTRDPQ